MMRSAFVTACVALVALAGSPWAVRIVRADGDRPALSASGERFEVVIASDAIAPGSTVPLDVYVSDFETNAPVAGATIDLRVLGGSGEVWSGAARATDAARPGVYRADFAAPKAVGDYRVILAVRAGGAEERFALAGLEVGVAHGADEHADANAHDAGAEGAGRSRGIPLTILLALVAVASALVTVVVSSLARRKGAGRTHAWLAFALAAGTAAFALAGGGAQEALAHEGHKDAPTLVGAGVSAGATVYLSKDSQFLLGVRTERARAEEVRRQISVIGRVAPRGGVELEITAPQSGRLRFASGKAPVVGRRYRAGEEIARLAVVDELVLRAPQSGVVTSVSAYSGQLVQAGQSIVSLVDPSVVWVHADVFEADLPRVQHATRAVIGSEAAPGLALPGKLVTIAATQGEVPGTAETWFEVPNPGERLKIGALVDVGIEEGHVDSSVVIARSAVFEKDGKRIVFVHTTPEHFEAREVDLLEGVGPRAAVKRGLQAGERVVVAGGYPLLSAPVAPRAR